MVVVGQGDNKQLVGCLEEPEKWRIASYSLVLKLFGDYCITAVAGSFPGYLARLIARAV